MPRPGGRLLFATVKMSRPKIDCMIATARSAPLAFLRFLWSSSLTNCRPAEVEGRAASVTMRGPACAPEGKALPQDPQKEETLWFAAPQWGHIPLDSLPILSVGYDGSFHPTDRSNTCGT